MNALKLVAASAAALLFSGCIFTTEPYHSSQSFDLEPPANAAPQSAVAVGIFNNDSPSRTHMLYRTNGTRMIHDEYNNWVQTPELILQRYFAAYFPIAPGSDTAHMIQLTATVEAFEIDSTQSAAVLKLEYTLQRDEKFSSGTLNVIEPSTENTPEAFAAAMSRAAQRAARELEGGIAKFEEK